jgi:RNA polymerase sigma factor (sigma-70 family)
VNTPPPFDRVLSQALVGLRDDDVTLFYDYFDELKRHVRRHLHRRARGQPGESAVAHSALVSLFCDVNVQSIPLNDVDEFGYPMLWPLLLKYVERHCEKWNGYYRARKRAGTVVSLGGGPSPTEGGVDPADYRDPEDGERFDTLLEQFYGRLSGQERQICELRMHDKTLNQIAQEVGCSEATVSARLRKIRNVLESM